MDDSDLNEIAFLVAEAITEISKAEATDECPHGYMANARYALANASMILDLYTQPESESDEDDDEPTEHDSN